MAANTGTVNHTRTARTTSWLNRSNRLPVCLQDALIDTARATVSSRQICPVLGIGGPGYGV